AINGTLFNTERRQMPRSMELDWLLMEAFLEKRKSSGHHARKPAVFLLCCRSRLKLACELLGVLLVRLEHAQTALQQRLQLRILCVWNECVAERSVDRPMIGHLIIDISLVKSCSAKAREFFARSVRLLGEALPGGIIFRLDFEFFHQRQRLIVHHRMISDHLLGKGADILVL